MATIRKRNDLWQVQVRRNGSRSVSKSFIRKSDAEQWARHMEVMADRGDLPQDDSKALSQWTLASLLERYTEEVLPKKRSKDSEKYHIRKILTYDVVLKRLSDLSLQDFSVFRDERLKAVKPATVVRELAIIRHCFVVAKDEWNIGDQTFGSDGSHSQRIGNMTFHDDGSVDTHIGNQTFGSDGSHSQRIGDMILFDD